MVETRERTVLPEPGPPLSVSMVPASTAGHAAVRITGVLDLATAPRLLSELTALADEGHQHLDLDLRQVTFCDCAGLSALLEGQRQMARHRGSVLLHDPCPSLATILDICDLTLSLQPRPTPAADRPAATPPPTLLAAHD